METVVKIIPCLDIQNGRVVKGINFVNMRDAGDPAETAAAYCQQGADELVFLDIDASSVGRSIHMDWVKAVAARTSVPLIVGGGISTTEQMESLFNMGATRISLNTAAVGDPNLVHKAARLYGPERIIVAIDGRKNPPESGLHPYEVLTHGGQKATGINLLDWARMVEFTCAGAILLTSIDTDGTQNGYDIEMTRTVAEAVNIPVIASGGAGKLEHFYEAVVEGKASGLLAASVFHFGKISIPEVKAYLKNRGIPVILETQ